MRIAATILALSLCMLCGASRPAQAAQLKIEVDMPSQLTFYTRPPATGTRLAKPQVRQLPFATEKLVEMVTEPVASGLRQCPVTVRITTGAMPDPFVDSVSRLQGLGVYSGFEPHGRGEINSNYVGVFVALDLIVSGNGLESTKIPVTGYRIRHLMADEPLQSFFDLHSDEVMAMLNELLAERFDTAVKAARAAAHC